mgnify:FL=1
MAITSKSTLRDVLADPRAVAVIEEYASPSDQFNSRSNRTMTDRCRS